MTVTIKDPMVKLSLNMAEMAFNHVCDVLKAKHPNNKQADDAIELARQAIDAALETLESL